MSHSMSHANPKFYPTQSTFIFLYTLFGFDDALYFKAEYREKNSV